MGTEVSKARAETGREEGRDVEGKPEPGVLRQVRPR